MSDVAFFRQFTTFLKITSLRPSNEGLLVLNHHLCNAWRTFIFVNRNQTTLSFHQRKMCLTGLHLLMVSPHNVYVLFSSCACGVGGNQSTSILFMKTFCFCSLALTYWLWSDSRYIFFRFWLFFFFFPLLILKLGVFIFLFIYWNNHSLSRYKTQRVTAPSIFLKWTFMYILEVCSHSSLYPQSRGHAAHALPL